MLFRTFGMVEVTGSAEVLPLSAEKPRRLLLLLLLRANHWVPDAELVDTVWPADVPASAAGSIRSYVSQLRGALAPVDDRANRIERRRGAYRLNARRDEIDSMIFEDLVERGRGAHGAEQTAKLLTEALDMWRGTPYEPLDTEPAKSELARLTELRWAARHMLAKALVDMGNHTAAIGLLRAMTVDDPLREQTWHSLMSVLHDSGRRAEALAAYQHARRALVDDLGIEPGADLRDLHEKVLRGDVRPTRTVPVPEVADTGPVIGPEFGARRPRHRWTIAALAVVVPLVAYLVAADVSQRDLPVGHVAAPAESHRWGSPIAEFTGDGMPAGWTANGPWPSHADGHYIPGNVRTRDGVAVIAGSANGDTGHFWRATDTTRGRVEVKVRIPRGCDCHRPGFSLWSVAQQHRAGEIVFLEVPGGDRQTARFAIHHPDRGSIAETRRVDLTVWNTVAVEWSPGHVTGFLNGDKWFHTDRKPDIPTSALRPTFKIDWMGGAGPTVSTVEIDWIRVYDV